MPVDSDFQNAFAICRDIHWVGYHDKEANLHCHPYLLIDEGDVVLFDPGSVPHFHIVMRKVMDLVDPEEISTIVASHQDPDVCGNLAVVEDVIGRSDLKIVAHTNTIRLIRHYGLRSDFYPVEQNGFSLKLRSGRRLEFIFTPYLHSPGAIATYDPQTRTLFSSDLFGAVSGGEGGEDWSLFVPPDFPASMDLWHQTYMPSNALLKPCMERLERLEIDRILPQHGSIIEGENVGRAIRHLKSLPCGGDLVGD
jgi:flavorubredoxin